MTRRQTKLYNLVMDCYRELYKEATPSADFDELLKDATINDEGQKVIDYDAYEIDFNKNHEIVEKYIKKGKLTFLEERGFKIQMFLGCAPRTKMRE